MKHIFRALALSSCLAATPAWAAERPAYQTVQRSVVNALGQNAAVAALRGGSVRIIYRREGGLVWRDYDPDGKPAPVGRIRLPSGVSAVAQGIAATAFTDGKTAIAFAGTARGATTPGVYVGTIDGTTTSVVAVDGAAMAAGGQVSVVALSSGNLAVAWSHAIGNRVGCIEAQVVSPAGISIGPRISVHGSGGCEQPAAVADGDGFRLFYFVGSYVYTQRHGSTGQMFGIRYRLHAAGAGLSERLTAVAMPGGGTGAFWTHRLRIRLPDNTLSWTIGLTGRFLAADGTQTRKFLFHDDAFDLVDENSLVAAATDTGVLLAWSAVAHPIPTVSFTAQLRGRFAGLDGKLGPVTDLALDAGQASTPWSIAGLENGRFAIAYDRSFNTRAPNSRYGLLLSQVRPVVDNPTPIDGDDGNNTLAGSDDRDLIRGFEGDDYLKGRKGDDRLEGGDGRDILVGGPGVDTMIGGSGQDDYSVDNPYDRIVEGASTSDTNRAFAFTDFALPPNVEQLTGLGPLSNTLVGNDMNNFIDGAHGPTAIYGGAGDDSLRGGWTNAVLVDGGPGADIMESVGGRIYVDNPGDVVQHSDDATVFSTITYRLPSDPIDLVGIGTAPVHLTGNGKGNAITGNEVGNVLRGLGGDDVLKGGAGNDTLDGGEGDDTLAGGPGTDRLKGGPGRDTFVVPPGGGDILLDYDPAEDTLIEQAD